MASHTYRALPAYQQLEDVPQEHIEAFKGKAAARDVRYLLAAAMTLRVVFYGLFAVLVTALSFGMRACSAA